MVNSAGERLADVVAAAVEVAAEAGEAGTYNAEVARAIAAVVNKVGARVVIDAEVRGFTSGWREAMDLVAGDDGEPARILRLPDPADDPGPADGRGDSPRPGAAPYPGPGRRP
ncbi:hypothetical protein GCM10009730_31720 [Streptomyces albidochromogenes]|uniref:hypothetical protein n=1 Tax=Streptomyces albidochromogenes TaxID=329524 RepID=UPI001FCC2CCB|nr:hypothetical protein [Streptomyces albidochromogenes]